MPPVAPSEFPPPFDPADVIGPPTDAEDERIEVGIAIVGGGPAGLACANKVMQLLEDEPELTEKLGEVPVAVIEKGKVAGAHLLSGANMKPSAMEELFPDLPKEEWPVFQEVTKDAVYLLTSKAALPLKPMPPNFRNHGNYVTSVSKLGRFLAEKAEEAGVYILSETAATKLLVEDRVVRGIRSGDRGRGKEGEELGNFEPGSDVVAKATVLAEGTVGHLTYAAYDYFDMHGADPMRWELGVKEVWEVPKPLDRVIHTMGWPLRKSPRFNEFGGSFIYPMGEDKLCIGLVAGLDYTDATFSVHDALQLLKTHPFVKDLLEGGKRVAWGAKTIPSGGYFAMPKRLAVPGMVVAGDAASMVNVPTLKGVHYAMHAGMYAAETIVESLKQDIDSVNFEAYDEKIHKSADREGPLRIAQHAPALLQRVLPRRRLRLGDDDHQRQLPRRALEAGARLRGRDGPRQGGRYVRQSPTTSSPSTSSTRSSSQATRPATTHPTTSASRREVPREIAQTWVSMCPAQVYEIPEEQLENGATTVDVHVTASNCVQCGAITAKGGRLTLPEGGDGPLYQET